MTDTINRGTTGASATARSAAGRGPRLVAGVATTAALGVALLLGVVISQTRQATRPTAATVSGTSGVAIFVPDQFTYREDHRALPAVIDFGPLECGTAPCVSAPTFVPDQFTYREDHRDTTTAPFVPDQFTYREDHRVSAPAIQDCATTGGVSVPDAGCNR